MLQIGNKPPSARNAFALSAARSAKPRKPLIHLASRIFGVPLCITRAKADTILAVLGPRLGLDASVLLAIDPDDLGDDDNDSGYEVDESGIATIRVFGTLVKRSSGMDARSGLTSYESLTNSMAQAVDDPNVRGILFDTDSPGGESDGMFEVCDLIYGLRGAKPMLAVADGQMCSAAYCVASSADAIVATVTAMIGSVGCFCVHVDQSQADKASGVRFSYISAGDRKVDGNPHEPLSARARNELQAEVDRIRAMFAGAVARNRKVSAQAVLATEAGVSYGPGAVPLFADRVATPAEAVEMLRAVMPASPAYSIPAPTPAARHPRLLGAPALHAGGLASDKAGWLSVHSNVAAHASLSAAVDRLQNEQPAIAARHGGNGVIEARLIQHPMARASVGASDRKVRLLVVPYNSLSIPIAGVREIYAPGCFADGLDEDPRCLFAHNEEKVIGRVSAGTAKFWQERDGVYCEAIGPDTTWFSDLLQSLRRGDINQASAAFWILRYHNETRAGERVRIVDSAVLRDGSVVAFAAYPQTTATLAPAASAAVPAAVARQHAACAARIAELDGSAARERARLRSLDDRLPKWERDAAKVEYLKLA